MLCHICKTCCNRNKNFPADNHRWKLGFHFQMNRINWFLSNVDQYSVSNVCSEYWFSCPGFFVVFRTPMPTIASYAQDLCCRWRFFVQLFLQLLSALKLWANLLLTVEFAVEECVIMGSFVPSWCLEGPGKIKCLLGCLRVLVSLSCFVLLYMSVLLFLLSLGIIFSCVVSVLNQLYWCHFLHFPWSFRLFLCHLAWQPCILRVSFVSGFRIYPVF